LRFCENNAEGQGASYTFVGGLKVKDSIVGQASVSGLAMKPQEKNMEFSKTTVTILAAPGNDLNL
jgi:hypothetical protein